VNSTVALDAMALGVPALSIGLPNNLSPFASIGAIAGAASDQEVAVALQRVLYDEEFRQQLSATAGAFVAAHGMGADGGAAERSTAAVLRLVEDSRRSAAPSALW
jgi:hypothetical protein